eukprot:2973518-Rhodomonas_salina.1
MPGQSPVILRCETRRGSEVTEAAVCCVLSSGCVYFGSSASADKGVRCCHCLLYTSPSPRDRG